MPPGYDPRAGFPQQPGVVQPAGSRPGGVLAAGIITIILSALTVLSSVVIFAAINDVTDTVHDYFRDHRDELNIKTADIPTDSDIKSFLSAFAVIFLIVGIIGIALAILTLMRQNWARIMLIVTSALTAVASIPMSIGIIGLPWLIGSIAVIVLLVLGKAKDWFAAPKAT